ncbi:MAG: hypothetical protein WAM77_28350 [Xanthobacteraceae bacterium]|jgi:hypothetical protein
MSIDSTDQQLPIRTYSGTLSFGSYGFLMTTTHPVSSIAELTAADDQYHDNVLTVGNDSANPGTKISELGGGAGVEAGGSGYRDGLYRNVYLTATSGSGTHARVNVIVRDGAVRRCDIIDGGRDFALGDTIGIQNDQIGGAGSGFSSTVRSLTGNRGNAATRYRDGVTRQERCAFGYNNVNNQQFFMGFPLLYAEIGNLNSDTWDTHFGVVSTHPPHANHFPGSAYMPFCVRGDTGEVQIASHDNQVWATFSDDHIVRIAGTLAVAPGNSVTPQKVGEIVLELTSDTTLTFKAMGSDGKVRSASLVLS